MHLLVAVSHHGLGHLAQAAPLLDRLRQLKPDLRFTMYSALPRAALAARIAPPFDHIAQAADCGMAMHDALRVDRVASLACYREFHRDWPQRVAQEAARLVDLAVDAVLSDVAYLPLAAAQSLGQRSAALCSLNWADIVQAYLGDAPEMAAPLTQMRMAYRGADLFLRLEPAMPMTDLANAVSVPPVAGRGRSRRGELRARLNLPSNQRLVLLGMGGIGYACDLAVWPRTRGITWLAPGAWCRGHPDCIAFDKLDWPFLDLLAGVDALVTKPGYGSFVEAVLHAVPVLYLDRPDWPEAPCLKAWLHAQGRALRIEEAELNGLNLLEKLNELWGLPARPAPPADGVEQAATHLLTWLA
ncbi:hypothetical protein EDC61_102122 [Sulfuritortus calidifontis]|uniref:UDP:flavonoid glycosyltransferase YjiC (YdhE family) n=1 Tax=Sulfuritortus calidifontis TaxID=1914471 RepID=A0A4R3JXT6_9PROT|nr:hypothetical protein [Sulfuritortus calidifontis]TCS73352.1 hypothetical protein EDC61_102122 [Sulfuritortus calidifontis]